MSETEFVRYVQRAGGLESESRAEHVAEAILAEFGRRISRGQADDLGGELPPRFGRALADVDERVDEPGTVDAFLEDVSERADLAGDVRGTVSGVLGAVAEFAGEAELSEAASQLPPEWGDVVDPEDVSIPDPFVDEVRARTSRGQDADDAAEAVLAVLGQRLTEGEADDLASYLHGDAEGWLLEEAPGDPETIAEEEFVDLVAERAGVTDDVAREYVDDVTATLAAVVPERELDRMAAQLPDDYGDLLAFEVAPSGT